MNLTQDEILKLLNDKFDIKDGDTLYDECSYKYHLEVKELLGDKYNNTFLKYSEMKVCKNNIWTKPLYKGWYKFCGTCMSHGYHSYFCVNKDYDFILRYPAEMMVVKYDNSYYCDYDKETKIIKINEEKSTEEFKKKYIKEGYNPRCANYDL